MSRRAALASIASTTSMSIAAPAIAIAASSSLAGTATNPDAELIRLGRELEAAEAEATRLYDISQDAVERYYATKPEPPNLARRWRLDANRYVALAPAELEDHVAGMPADQAAKVRAAWQQHEDECQRAHDEAGVTTAEEAYNLANSRELELFQRVIKTPATTVAGLYVKLRPAWEIISIQLSASDTDDDLGYDERLLKSAFEDARKAVGARVMADTGRPFVDDGEAEPDTDHHH